MYIYLWRYSCDVRYLVCNLLSDRAVITCYATCTAGRYTNTIQPSTFKLRTRFKSSTHVIYVYVHVIFMYPYSVIDVLSNSFVAPSSRRYDWRNKLFYIRTALGEFRVIRKRRAIEKYRHRLKTLCGLSTASVYGDTFFFQYRAVEEKRICSRTSALNRERFNRSSPCVKHVVDLGVRANNSMETRRNRPVNGRPRGLRENDDSVLAPNAFFAPYALLLRNTRARFLRATYKKNRVILRLLPRQSRRIKQIKKLPIYV